MRHEYIYSRDAERYAFVAIPVTIIKKDVSIGR